MVKSRQLDILMILLRDKSTKAINIAKELEIHIRTVERNINILTRMGIPIQTRKGRNGGIYIDEKYKLDKSIFSPNNFRELALAINIYDSIFNCDFRINILKELGMVNPEILRISSLLLNNYFEIDLFDEKINFFNKEIESNVIMLDQIREAIGYNKNLIIQIKDYKNRIDFFPISYVLRKEALYLYGFNSESLLINVEKILSLKIGQAIQTEYLPLEKKYQKGYTYKIIG